MRCASWVNALSLAALVGCTSPRSDSAAKSADGARDYGLVGFSRVNFVRHSIAGGELTAFAARYPDRVRRLIYLDAAYDHRVQSSATRPPLPPMTRTDSSSPEAVLAYSSQLGQPLPLGEIRATEVFDSTGHLLRDVTPGSVYREL